MIEGERRSLVWWELSRWEEWVAVSGGGQNNHIGLTKIAWGKESYVDWHNRFRVKLLACAGRE